MATKKTTEPEEEKIVEEKPFNERAYWMERVPFRAFKDSGKYKDDITVGYNGRVYVIKRGVEVMIPRAVREIIFQSEEQDQRTAELIDMESSRFAAESRRYE